MLLDLRVFVLAALVASPAGFLLAQGELTLDEALTRLLVVMVGATAAAMAARTLWPLLAGTTPELRDAVPDDVARDDLAFDGPAFDGPAFDGLADPSALPEAELVDDLFGFEDLGSFGSVEELSPLPE
ncbi:hypothetical protein [Nocardioides daeguensis]|uniref:Uncharacterized protein n=1 Tax=Nocardioides daeguensis TaxID=908359 RepID=A0ABP6V992_9ACTN|nr:hypothetical protein [Nocardioides daeguensis]MBV6726144.1 hypothetical protein [Nocardioides daeguensis]MCR1771987.1 hypothetical protein [Nocardioides daeguensis]